LAFSLEISRVVRSLSQPIPVRCIVATNETNGTFRFHRIRDGERWERPDLDSYSDKDMVVTVDVEPPKAGDQVTPRS
jgi:hypothetical protein